MIIHYAQGGLGNQLFNYAAARSLADRVNTDLLIDTESYRDQWANDALRPFLLGNFPIRAKFRNLGQKYIKQPLVSRLIRRLNEDILSTIIERSPNEIAYFSKFDRLGKRTILKGHFIDYRFFYWNNKRLSEDLKLCDDILNNDWRGCNQLAAIHSAECAVAVHVRRGDLLNQNNKWLLLDGVGDYYKNAMMVMQARYSNASYFVFSDDPDWCTRQFSGEPFKITVVESGNNPVKDILVDFFLMTACKHNVIANSAFSWWAAWLNRNPDKTVMAPHIYDSKQTIPIEQIIPPEWVKVFW